jgi:hypothetical protein
MSGPNESTPNTGIANPSPITRRTALLEFASIGLVLGVPIAAAVSTAQPIADPPNRKTLDLAPAARVEAEEQLKQETKRRRAAAKEAEAQREAEAAASQQDARDKNKNKDKDKDKTRQKRQDAAEQSATTP